MAPGEFRQDRAPRAPEPRSSKVHRTYAIGDVHGRFDLFKTLTHRIASDQAKRASPCTQIVLLGNILDLGPDTVRMVRGCMALTASTDRFVVLKGNHEDMMGEALRGDLAVYSNWLHFGGRKTLLDWGVAREVADGPATMENLVIAAEAVGADVIEWLVRLPLFCRVDGYLLVHAGIRPGIDLDKQDPDDLLWIRKEFLESDASHGVVVVHGHTAERGGPTIRPNRIGIDTDAHRTGRLTALAIENGDVWSFDTVSQGEALEPDTARVPHHDALPDTSIKASPGSFGPGGFGDEQLDADLKAILAPLEWAAVPRRSLASRPDVSSRQRSASSVLTLAASVKPRTIGARAAVVPRIDAPTRGGDMRRAVSRRAASILAFAVCGGAVFGIAALGLRNAIPVQRQESSSVTVLINRPATTAPPVVAFAVRSPVVPTADEPRRSADADARPEPGSTTTASRFVHPSRARADTTSGKSHPDPAPTSRAASANGVAATATPDSAVGSFGDAPPLTGNYGSSGEATPTDADVRTREMRQARRDSIHAMRLLRRQ